MRIIFKAFILVVSAVREVNWPKTCCFLGVLEKFWPLAMLANKSLIKDTMTSLF
jgi:hypothetical protein